MNLEFKSFIENNNVAYQLIDVSGSSNGSYGFGDREETPAGDPRHGVTFEVFIDHRHEPYLVGSNVILVDNGEGGSYHERWWSGYACAELTDDAIEEMHQKGIGSLSWVHPFAPASRYKKNKPIAQFKYSNIKDLIHSMIEHFSLEPSFYFANNSYKNNELEIAPKYWKNLHNKNWHDEVPKPGQSSEEYWNKLVKKTWMPKPKDQWEGD